MENTTNQLPHKTDPELDEINKDIQHYRNNTTAIGIFNGILITLSLIFLIWLFLSVFKWR